MEEETDLSLFFFRRGFGVGVSCIPASPSAEKCDMDPAEKCEIDPAEKWDCDPPPAEEGGSGTEYGFEEDS